MNDMTASEHKQSGRMVSPETSLSSRVERGGPLVDGPAALDGTMTGAG
jgi:hypothetical protein